MVLLPLIRSNVEVPIIAAGGICDGVSMAAAFAPALRCIRTEKTTALEKNPDKAMPEMIGHVDDVYFRGEIEEGIALTGQIAGRIDSVRPVAEIIDDTVRGFFETVGRLSSSYAS